MMNYPNITLKAARVNASLTQKEAARLLHISQSTLQSYESGETVPSYLMVKKIERKASQRILCKRIFQADKNHAKIAASMVKQDNPLPLFAVLPGRWGGMRARRREYRLAVREILNIGQD